MPLERPELAHAPDFAEERVDYKVEETDTLGMSFALSPQGKPTTHGIKMRMAIGSRFWSKSLGTPWRVMVAACDSKLLKI